MQINLLPWRGQSRTANKKEFIQIFLFSLLILLLILWSWYWLLSYQLVQQKSTIVFLNKNIAAHMQQDQAAALLMTRKQQLTADSKFLQQQKTINTHAAEFLNVLTNYLPAGMLLVQLKWEGNYIVLTGKTTSTEAVNLFIHHLQTLSWLLTPQIQEINNNEFTVSAKINA